MLGQLVRTVGPGRARLAYQSSVDAISLLDALDERLGRSTDFLRRDDLMLRYGARRRCALYSADAATVDPVRLARRLLDDAGAQRGTRTFSKALVERVEPRADHVVLRVADGSSRPRPSRRRMRGS